MLLAAGAAFGAGAGSAGQHVGVTLQASPGRNGAIAFYHRSVQAERNGEWGDVYVVGARGGSLRRIARRAASPAWSPDGRQLALNTGEGFRRLPGAPVLVPVPVYGPSWAPDGQRLVGMTGEGIWVSIFDLRTRQQERIYEDEGAGSPGMFSPDWSPNGRLIAMAYEFGGNFGIALFNVADRRFARDWSSMNAVDNPSWSPGGGWIAFDTDTGAGKPERSAIYVARANGTGRRLLVRNGHSPAWSPDGKMIAFVRAVTRTNSEIFVINVNGSGILRLTKLPGPEEAPSWQPLPRR